MSLPSKYLSYSLEVVQLYYSLQQLHQQKHRYPDNCLAQMARAFVASDAVVPNSHFELLKFSLKLAFDYNFHKILASKKKEKELIDVIMNILLCSNDMPSLSKEIEGLFSDYPCSLDERKSILKMVISLTTQLKFEIQSKIYSDSYRREHFIKDLEEKRRVISVMVRYFEEPQQDRIASTWRAVAKKAKHHES